jgi:hypothetical protein
LLFEVKKINQTKSSKLYDFFVKKLGIGFGPPSGGQPWILPQRGRLLSFCYINIEILMQPFYSDFK